MQPAAFISLSSVAALHAAVFTLTRPAGTPLCDAIREGHSEIAEMLRNAGARESVVAGESVPQQKVHPSPAGVRSLLSFIFSRVSAQGATLVTMSGADYGSVDLTSSQLRKRKQ